MRSDESHTALNLCVQKVDYSWTRNRAVARNCIGEGSST